MPQASFNEKQLSAALVNPRVSCAQFWDMLRSVPAGEHFRAQSAWTEYAKRADLDAWRRLAAYQILIEKCVSFPPELRGFVAEAILAIDLMEKDIVDMTPAHNLPFPRKGSQKIRMLPLPFLTALGAAALYFAVDAHDQHVEQAAVYPSLEALNKQR